MTSSVSSKNNYAQSEAKEVFMFSGFFRPAPALVLASARSYQPCLQHFRRCADQGAFGCEVP
jgi:hypothetical protein